MLGAGLLFGGLLRADTLRDRVVWTDRTIGQPAAEPMSDITPTIERFWNVQLEEFPSETATSNAISRPAVTQAPVAQARMQAQQRRDVREHRGHWGINLFNIIPLVDIVHGEVRTESSDSIEGRR